MNGFQEVGDRCEGTGDVTEGGYALARIWNNARAAAGDEPCQPEPPDELALPYFGASIAVDTFTIALSETTNVEVDCYSFAPLPADIALTADSTWPLVVTFDAPTCKNGDKVTMSLHIEANGDPGSLWFQIHATLPGGPTHDRTGTVTAVPDP